MKPAGRVDSFHLIIGDSKWHIVHVLQSFHQRKRPRTYPHLKHLNYFGYSHFGGRVLQVLWDKDIWPIFAYRPKSTLCWQSWHLTNCVHCGDPEKVCHRDEWSFVHSGGKAMLTQRPKDRGVTSHLSVGAPWMPSQSLVEIIFMIQFSSAQSRCYSHISSRAWFEDFMTTRACILIIKPNMLCYSG